MLQWLSCVVGVLCCNDRRYDRESLDVRRPIYHIHAGLLKGDAAESAHGEAMKCRAGW